MRGGASLWGEGGSFGCLRLNCAASLQLAWGGGGGGSFRTRQRESPWGGPGHANAFKTNMVWRN